MKSVHGIGALVNKSTLCGDNRDQTSKQQLNHISNNRKQNLQ